jgi:hypothetical protein
VTDLGSTVNYCRLATTTCEGLLHHRTPQGSGATRCGNSPDGTSDDACGAAGVADAVCRTSAGSNRCTYRCGSVDDCREGFLCTDFPGDGTPTTYCGI